ncbi:hypothetical protein HK104_009052 [Borealophlyctis nickersoniae]|nr:hypothetical protein HK104_009052 [Borealophlyctis nickersoniae]
MCSVNKTSSLQFHSIFYRFHPTVRFKEAYPHRDHLLRELKRVWRSYDLPKRTRFNTKVTSVKPKQDYKWDVNGEEFDGVIVAIGTCGPPNIPPFKGLDRFKHEKYHSSEMEKIDIPEPPPPGGFKIVVLGSGASAVEVVDFVLELLVSSFLLYPLLDSPGKIDITTVARHDKWIFTGKSSSLEKKGASFDIPRNDPNRSFLYKNRQGMAPTKPFYASTPCLNSRFLELVRRNKIRYIRGHVSEFDEDSVRITNVEWDSRTMLRQPATVNGTEVKVPADVVVFATGFKRPDWGFVDPVVWKDEKGRESFKPPNLFLTTFPPAYPTMVCINDTYINAVATAGHFHIGLLTGLLVMFILDPSTRPTYAEASTWVNQNRAKLSAAEASKREYDRELLEGERPSVYGGYDRSVEEGLRFCEYY